MKTQQENIPNDGQNHVQKARGKEDSNLASLNKNLHYTIDAAGRTLGRVASLAAKALMGKTRADYTPNKNSDVKVTVSNAGKLYIRERKRSRTIYTTYSGYPGGLKKESLASLTARKGNGEAIRRAVARMLPRNTMHTPRMKNLTVSN